MTMNPTTPAILALLASPNEALRGVLTKRVPTASTLAEAMQACTTQRASLLTTVNSSEGAWAQVIAETVDALVAGHTIEFAERAHAANTAKDIAEVGLGLLNDVESHLSTRLVADVTSARDEMLHDLHGQVVEVIGKARQLPLRGVEDAEDAIASGRAGEWAELARLRTEYLRLRHAQQAITTIDRDGTARHHHATFAWIRNYADMYPSWATGSISDGTVTYGVSTPWPDDEPGKFRWLIDHQEAQPWAPTDTELEAAVAAARANAQAKRAEEVQRRHQPDQTGRVVDVIG